MATTNHTVFVAGATGATGKYLVKLLLDKSVKVRVVVRSKERMTELLAGIGAKDISSDQLQVTEAALLDLTDEQLEEQVKDCKAVVSCLGHNLTMKGIFGHPRKLVADATKRLIQAIDKNKNNSKTTTKFILMGSDGVAHPDDDIRSCSERTIISIIRYLIPPHSDNEDAAAYLLETLKTTGGVEWSVVRPTDLIDGEPTKYQLYDKPIGSLFGSGTATRANVALCMVDLIIDDEKWNQYKFKMPVLHNFLDDKEKEEKAKEEEKK